MSVQEIETAIAKLPGEELAELITWLDDFRAQAWDAQIEADLDSGKLDALLAEVDAEHAAGLSRPL